ncbi:hypothetical protein [Neisseria elongata]|uniref:Uncharacterized protein n=1 Tax=Neisseria elongata subsp. glycolytica ATCC 29315 TaxID=546263 RepID=D4DPN8_NEIEG|nr:hypothetical protein [Neisseria elongata]EFE50170.1 hypothetical protein NEIELOOT_01025 [Neisseria elongata subsp. glycolytica ATCC 29315]
MRNYQSKKGLQDAVQAQIGQPAPMFLFPRQGSEVEKGNHPTANVLKGN